jgi:hypothetical protein
MHNWLGKGAKKCLLKIRLGNCEKKILKTLRKTTSIMWIKLKYFEIQSEDKTSVLELLISRCMLGSLIMKIPSSRF